MRYTYFSQNNLTDLHNVGRFTLQSNGYFIVLRRSINCLCMLATIPVNTAHT